MPGFLAEEAYRQGARDWGLGTRVRNPRWPTKRAHECAQQSAHVPDLTLDLIHLFLPYEA